MKKAKYCINTRDENSTKNIITYECNKCFKSFTSNHGRNKHQEKCKYINNDSVVEILKNQLNEINQQNRDLQNNLNKLADNAVSKSTTSIINNNKKTILINNKKNII